jgi:hypothetical protein
VKYGISNLTSMGALQCSASSPEKEQEEEEGEDEAVRVREKRIEVLGGLR